MMLKQQDYQHRFFPQTNCNPRCEIEQPNRLLLVWCNATIVNVTLCADGSKGEVVDVSENGERGKERVADGDSVGKGRQKR